MKIVEKVKAPAMKAIGAIKQHSPEILVVSGIVGAVGAAVMACVASTKLHTVIEETKEKAETVHEAYKENNPSVEGGTYTEKEMKRDLTKVYAEAGLKLVRLYGPSVVVGSLSITGILASNNILKKRNLGLAAAYMTIDKTFKEYRGRVVEKFGEKVDKELRYGIKEETVETETTDEKGKKKVVKEKIEVVNENEFSGYARIFDETNPYYEKNSEYNKMFISAQQAHANDLLRANGYLFLNDVYEMLGFSKTRAGQVVGWIYDPKNCDHEGDNYIDFGLFDVHKESSRNFVNGHERAVVLDFNVDGPIMNNVSWENT